MRLKTDDGQLSQSDERKGDDKAHHRDQEQSLLTPARRAALDALEREFHDLLRMTRAA